MQNKFYKLAICFMAGIAMTGSTNAQTIYTFSGSTAGFAGDGGPATAARMSYPSGIQYKNGNIYLVDPNNEKIRKIEGSGSYTITSIAGNNLGFSGDGGPATAANTYMGSTGGDVVVDNSGNVYFSDVFNGRVRKINTAGIISTVAGGGSSSDGSPATAASLNRPMGLDIDASGNLYICDEQDHRIRKVDASTGIITTVAGNGSNGHTGDGGAATSAEVGYPDGVAVDAAGNIYIASYDHTAIRKVDASTGIISSFATGFNQPAFMDFDQAGNLFVGSFHNNGNVCMVSPSGTVTVVAGNSSTSPTGDGGPATAAGLGSPRGVTVTANGSLLISTRNNHRVRVVLPATATISGTATTCIGSTTPLTASIPAATWISSSPSVATVSATGVVTGVASGTATITYVAGLIFGTRVVTVNAPVSPTITASGTTLSVPATYATYQWTLDGTPISGATNATHIATATGTYVVNVTDASGCTTTSATYVVSTLSLLGTTAPSPFSIYPNPATNKQFTINLPDSYNQYATVSITNIAGETVLKTVAENTTTLPVSLNVPAGIYIVHIITANTSHTARVTIQ